MKGSTISKIDYYLPKHILSNQDLANIYPEWNANQIEKKVGIMQRHIAEKNETVTDMAVKAAENLFKTYDRNKIDFVLFCTQSPDYKLPTSACIIQERLGLSTKIGALDFNLGCTGFIYGLSLAKGLIASGSAKHVLFLTAETYSKYIHPEDKGNRTIFGDAATATLIEESDTNKIGEFVFGTDGAGADKLIIKEGGSKIPFACPEHTESWLYMDGPEIFNFTINIVPKLFKQVLDKNNETIDSLNYIVYHQANAFMLNFLRKTSGIPKEKFFIDMKYTGNTVSNTIPIALNNSFKNNLIKNGNKIALIGFGVGLSWAGTIIEVDSII